MNPKITPGIIDKIKRERAPFQRRVRKIRDLLKRYPSNISLLIELDRLRVILREIERRILADDI